MSGEEGLLVPFVLHADAIPMTSSGAGPRSHVEHLRFLEIWERLGVLIVPHEDQVRSIWRAVQTLGEPVRSRWKALIAQRVIVSEKWARWPSDVGGVGLCKAVREQADEVRLLCLPEAQLDACDLPQAQGWRRHKQDGFEIARFDCFDMSRAIQNGYEAAHADIRTGTPVDEVWRTRFLWLARLARGVVIVDRYAGKSFLSPKAGMTSGLERVLTKLAEAGRERGRPLLVTVYTAAVPPRWDPAQSEDENLKRREREERFQEKGIHSGLRKLMASLPRGGLRQLNLFVTSDQVFRDVAHDRYICFDDAMCQLGRGIDVLGPDPVKEVSSFDLKSGRKTNDGGTNRFKESVLEAHQTTNRLNHGRPYELR